MIIGRLELVVTFGGTKGRGDDTSTEVACAGRSPPNAAVISIAVQNFWTISIEAPERITFRLINRIRVTHTD